MSYLCALLHFQQARVPPPHSCGSAALMLVTVMQRNGHAKGAHLSADDIAQARRALRDLQQHQANVLGRVDAFKTELQQRQSV